MPSTLTQLIAAVTDALGRDDAKAQTWATRGINYAQLMAALYFNPPELMTSGTLTLSSSGVSVSLSSLTNLRVIDQIYNTTAAKRMFSVPFEKWYVLDSGGSGNAKFYSRRNLTLFTSPTPSIDNTLTCYYRRYPDTLVSGSDELDFETLDGFITTTATQLAWAYQEEADSAGIFKVLSDAIGVPTAMDTKLRQEFEEGARRVEYNLSRDQA